jgi:hypothetical protein
MTQRMYITRDCRPLSLSRPLLQTPAAQGIYSSRTPHHLRAEEPGMKVTDRSGVMSRRARSLLLFLSAAPASLVVMTIIPTRRHHKHSHSHIPCHHQP